MTQKRLIVWSIIGTGVSSVNTQLLIIREFLSQFHGNEITISLTLFCWLAPTALGRFAAKLPKRYSASGLSFLILGAALAPLPEILLIRMARTWCFPHGTAPGLIPSFSISCSPQHSIVSCWVSSSLMR